MANKYIKDLITTTNPSLTGHTIFDNGVTTFKTSLETLKDTIVDGLSHTFEGDQTINGNLVISGSVVAQEFILSSSITNVEIQNISGSSNFGNDLEDTHNFTGSVNITGSLYLNNGEVNISGSGSHLAFFTGPQSITSSHDFHIIENGHTLALGIDVTSTTFGDEEYRERLIVGNSDSHNIATFQIADGNHYAAVNIINYNDGDNASADLVIMNNIQDESGSYFNLGLNSTNHTNLFCGYAGDAYLYTTSHDLYMGSMFVGTGVTGNGHTHIFGGAAWRSPSVSIYSDTSVGFFTEKFNNQLSTIPSFNQGFKTEFSGSVKMNNNLKVDGSVTASYFVGDGSQLINLPTQEINTDSFATTGSNTFVGNQLITGSVVFGDGGVIQSISSSSADGGGYSTLTLTPDSSLGSDQYLILDPTGPNHIHIRPGGTIDNSNSDLYVGGEKNYLRVSDSTPSVRMQTENDFFVNGYNFSTGNGYSTAEWYTENGNHFVRFNDPTMDVYSAMWSFSSVSTFSAFYNNGNDYINFTVNGSSTPGFPQASSFYVSEAPPSSPTFLSSVEIEIRQNREVYIEINNNDININASDDLRLYSRDRFRLLNYSSDEPIEFVLDYDNTDKTFSFNPDGTLEFPDGTRQNTAFTTSSITNLATTGSNTFVGDQTINGNLTIGTVSENVTSYLDWVGNLVFNYGSGSIFYITGLTSNGQFNVFNVPETNDKAVTFTFVIEQGSTPYSGSLYMINDSQVNVKWMDNIIPTGSANKTDIIGLTAFRINSTWNVLGSLSTFG